MVIGMLSVFCSSAIATEPQNVSPEATVSAITFAGNAEIMPASVVELARDEGMVTMDAPLVIRVTPAKGTNLRITIGCLSSYYGAPMSNLKISTTKQGGWWPSNTTTITANGQTSTYTLIQNCNGETYTIKMEPNGGEASYAAFIVFSSEFTA